ncbi:hypothetical protein ZWY2020_025930 [Hordeum vulgare]|nr:hypothetical protein ZWY2020_025930 [Hordeum vulgare]
MILVQQAPPSSAETRSRGKLWRCTAYIMSRDPVDLSPGQLHKLADLIHRQEVQKLLELEFQSYAEQQKYLNDAKDARDKVYHVLDSAQDMIKQTEDPAKQSIAKDVYDYCTKAIEHPPIHP